LFLGTDQGLYFSIDYGDNWTKWTRDFPSVPVNDLKIHPREHDLIIATFGRALWIMDDIRPLRLMATAGKSVLEKDFFLMPVQDVIASEFRSVDGIRYNGAADFTGQNVQRGAVFTMYVKLPTETKPEKTDSLAADKVNKKAQDSLRVREKPRKKGEEDSLKVAENPLKPVTEKPDPAKNGNAKTDKVKVHILSPGGDSLRTFTAKTDTGFVRVRWTFDRDGTTFPQYKSSLRDDLPGGPPLPPGTYRVVMVYGHRKDSSTFKVLPDPRMNYDPAQMADRETKITAYLRNARAATKAFDQLRDAREMIDRYEKLLENADEKLRDSLKKVAKPVRDSIRNLMELYLEPEDHKGLDHVSEQLGDRYFTVSELLEPLYTPPGGNADLALRLFEAEVRRTVQRINHFLENEWKAYRLRMEAAKVPLFKDLPPVKLE
jgi:hypothetical protein